MIKRTKIVATIGPASSSKEILKKMIEAGMNVVRINFSHGDHISNGELIRNIRKLREEMNLPIGIMADLEGPRIRVMVDNDLKIKNGEKVLIVDLSIDDNFSRHSGTPPRRWQSISNDKISRIIKLDKKDIIKSVEVDNEILIEDGKIKLKVLEKDENGILAEVEVAGTIKNHKGVNIPDAELPFGVLTEKDTKDLEFALSQEVDFVALSFVGGAKDVKEAKEKIKQIAGRAENLPIVVSKIERKEAIKNIDEIIEETDAVMVARGDLGIEMPETKVVIFQKEIIEKCLTKNKPVIVATQMLESMIENPLPTRAEVSDVTNAVIDHADAVMLSGESANWKYPVEAVAIMAKIISDTEESPYDDNNKKLFDHSNLDEYQAVIDAAHELAKSAKARAILMFSFWGNTPRMMSQHRPNQWALLATQNKKNFFQTSILWGISANLMGEKENQEEFSTWLIEKGKTQGLLQKGDKAVIIMGRLPNGEKMRLVGIQEVA